jgi:nucleoside-diphosphate-sugar epimerase
MGIQTVAVTGGHGRIGRAIVETLNQHDYRTIALDRYDRFGTEERRQEAEAVADESLTVDLLDAGEVYGALGSSDADAVIHMGTIRGATHHPGHAIYESNVMTTYNVLEAATELALEAACVASSLNAIGSVYQTSQGVFATGDPVEVAYLPMDESHPQTPRDPYAIAKHAVEVTADGFGRLDKPPHTIASLRFPWVLKTDELQEFLGDADRTLAGLEGAADEIGGAATALGRDVIFSYLHLDDAATIARRAIEADFGGHERFWAVADDTTAAVPSAELAAEYFPTAERRHELEGTEALINTGKAADLLGWEPAHSWRDG